MKKQLATAAALAALTTASAAGAAIAASKITIHAGQSAKVGKTTVRCVAAPLPAATSLDFTGNGGLTLAPFRLARGETLTWTDDGGYFALTGGAAFVNSQGASGTSYLKAGVYTLDVIADGNWTITIRP
jgi:hypothetical protein